MGSEIIVFVVDVGDSMLDSYPNDAKSKLDHVRGAIARFIPTKQTLSTDHRFSIACLTTTLVWLLEPTTETEVLLDMLSQLEPQHGNTFCDLEQVLRDLKTTIGAWELGDDRPSLRLILVYGRSDPLFCNEATAAKVCLFDRCCDCDSSLLLCIHHSCLGS
eukprot:m.31400 g.31400  ORF g.31400 m.31400 type:complete len:161 (-) comp12069_c0_seq2:303-785(-)